MKDVDLPRMHRSPKADPLLASRSTTDADVAHNVDEIEPDGAGYFQSVLQAS